MKRLTGEGVDPLLQREAERSRNESMSYRGEVLVAIIRDLRDFAIASEKQWYRIPIDSQQKWLRNRWPPQWLSLYQTKSFGQEAYAINYYAQVLDIRQAYRWQLFTDEPHNEKHNRPYYQLLLEPLRRLPRSIISRRRRRIVFITTTWQKFSNAVEVNDLYDESPLEDRLWSEFKRLRIQSERQEHVTINKHHYFLDFAIYCASGKIDVETDGDEWHANSKASAQDNIRDNDLESSGWRQLRFTAHQIQEQMAGYCIPTIVQTINHLDGLEEGKPVPRKLDPGVPNTSFQLGLFDGS